eukprot:scaffold71368_cov64-Cyclotella_meneghiniana.AAC.1
MAVLGVTKIFPRAFEKKLLPWCPTHAFSFLATVGPIPRGWPTSSSRPNCTHRQQPHQESALSIASNTQQRHVSTTDDHAHVMTPSSHATSAPVPLPTLSGDQRRRPKGPCCHTDAQHHLTGTQQAAAAAAEETQDDGQYGTGKDRLTEPLLY